MKKAIISIIIAAALLASFFAGRANGIRHAIQDSEIWAVECYNPEDPEASAWGEYDMRVFIDLDGETYEHGMFQG